MKILIQLLLLQQHGCVFRHDTIRKLLSFLWIGAPGIIRQFTANCNIINNFVFCKSCAVWKFLHCTPHCASSKTLSNLTRELKSVNKIAKWLLLLWFVKCSVFYWDVRKCRVYVCEQLPFGKMFAIISLRFWSLFFCFHEMQNTTTPHHILG